MLEATVNARRNRRSLAAELERRIDACQTFPTAVEATLEGDGYAWLQQQVEDFKLIWGNRGVT